MIIYGAIPEQRSSAFDVDVDRKYQQCESDTGEQKEYYVQLGVIMAICFGCCAELEKQKKTNVRKKAFWFIYFWKF